MPDKSKLIELSRRLLERRGYLVAPPCECANVLIGDLMAIDPLKRFVVVWVTTPLQCFDLWLELLGEEVIQHALKHPRGGFLRFQIHKWETGLDGEDRCSVEELNAVDFTSLARQATSEGPMSEQWQDTDSIAGY